MTKKSIGRKILSLLLVLTMLVPTASLQADAAVGDLSNVSTGLTGDIDTEDTISLPIKIYDYEADGMLFEYAESYAEKDPEDFGATWAVSFTKELEEIGDVTNSMYGNFWNCTTNTLNTDNAYASFLRATWSGNSTTGGLQGRAGALLPNDIDLSMNNARYLVLVYRSNISSGKISFFVERADADRNNTNNLAGDYTFTSEGTTNWTYAIYDLKQGELAKTWDDYGNAKAVWTTLPMDNKNEYIDIAHVALFADSSQAQKFAEYALTDGSDRGDNRGFGLLRGSRHENDNGTDENGRGSAFNGITTYEGAKDTVYQLNTYGDTLSSIDMSSITTLGYTLLGTFGDNGIANVGLLQSALSAEGYPVYKEEVVTYVANLLKHSLEIPERTSDGWKNYRYVKGTSSSVYGGTDLATALRSHINGNMGSYAAAGGKKLVGTWEECEGNIASYYDAAYFLLNSIFVPGSYNTPQDTYDYLVLSAGTDAETNEKVYVFDGGFTTSATPESAEMAIDYNEEARSIKNISAAGKSHFVYEGSSTTTLNPFLPVTDRNSADGQTHSVYYQDDGILNTAETKDTYVNRNFNYVMVSKGEFVYHAEDDLFFNFEGDDDVYLFINGELVMDLGSAHSIDVAKFSLNDYVNAAKANLAAGSTDERDKKLALEEGNTYTFDFYYMERHGYGANIRVETNIHVTDPSMTTQKTAYQTGVQLDFGSIVDKDKVVEYGFAITNNGAENLHNLTFTDNDIGVKLDPANGLTVTGSRVYDMNGGTLEVGDLTAIVSHPDYDDIIVTFGDNDTLKAFLASLTSDAVIENGGGLWINSTVLIRGIGYKLTDAQVKAGVFDNTVFTTSTNHTKSKTLNGQATMRVFVPADPMYYQWAGHALEISFEKLVSDVLAAASQTDNVLAGKVPNLTTENVDSIEVTAANGTSITHSYVAISETTVTVNYPKAGSYVFYLKITHNTKKNTVIVPVLANVTDVENSVYVLDYGLGVELTEGNELYKNDVLTIPGRDTENGLMALGTETPAYAPNCISFTAIEGSEYGAADGYGKFALKGNVLRYIPGKFLEGMESIWLAMNVYESDHTPSDLGVVDINNEVQMFKSVTVLPANVVYYEDDFPAIKYNKENEFTAIGSGNLTQSADQDTEYGSDDTYADSANDEMSGNSLYKVTINENSTVASLTFKGTGFELIGRTNASDSATLIIRVKDADGNSVKTIPVITEFDNGADGGAETIYQVPVIRVDGLTLGTYTLEITGVPARDYNQEGADGSPAIIPTYLYIDGLRIYQPIGEGNEHYNETENGATFAQIRDLIIDGQVAAVDYDNESVYTSTGTVTWTENRNGEDIDGETYTGNQVDSVADYLTMGPNNEVYMNGDLDYAALVLYVKPVEGAAVNNLQIAVHAVDVGEFFGAGAAGMDAKILFGVKDGDAYAWADLAQTVSGTEQYYAIDLSKCPVLDDGRIQVAVAVDSGMASFTSLKYNGVTIESINGESTTLYYDEGVLKDKASGVAVTAMNYPEFEAVSLAMYALAADIDVDTESEAGANESPEETAPSEEETGSVENTVPSEEETGSVEETAPAEEETAPAEEETAPVEEETVPAEESGSDEESNPAEETSEPSEEESSGEDESGAPESGETYEPDEETTESFEDKVQKRADMIRKLIEMLRRLWGLS
ncbi:MAG: fibro-slime domain-containing protein [Lachnospiraceae bacterium]|nr:fibro-slime domain-containing protein [Lachnospiraceae bacterium]